jgi:hypothetical protein
MWRVLVVMLTASREEANLMSSYEDRANADAMEPIRFKESFDAVQKVGAFWVMLDVSATKRCKAQPPCCLRILVQKASLRYLRMIDVE